MRCQAFTVRYQGFTFNHLPLTAGCRAFTAGCQAFAVSILALTVNKLAFTVNHLPITEHEPRLTVNNQLRVMNKFSVRLSIVFLTFVTGIFTVAGWFYYQKLQPNQMIVPNARWDSLLFNGVSEHGGINKITELGGLSELREAHLQKGDIEIRVWRGFSLSSTEGVVLKRTDGQWSGLHIKTDDYDDPQKAEVKLLTPPKSGWESFSQQLIDKEILTLPQSTENECDVTQVVDGMLYVVEINQDKIYRTYYYPDGIGKLCREAGQMNEIGEFIGSQFYSGKVACKLGEWLFCPITD